MTVCVIVQTGANLLAAIGFIRLLVVSDKTGWLYYLAYWGIIFYSIGFIFWAVSGGPWFDQNSQSARSMKYVGLVFFTVVTIISGAIDNITATAVEHNV